MCRIYKYYKHFSTWTDRLIHDIPVTSAWYNITYSKQNQYYQLFWYWWIKDYQNRWLYWWTCVLSCASNVGDLTAERTACLHGVVHRVSQHRPPADIDDGVRVFWSSLGPSRAMIPSNDMITDIELRRRHTEAPATSCMAVCSVFTLMSAAVDVATKHQHPASI